MKSKYLFVVTIISALFFSFVCQVSFAKELAHNQEAAKQLELLRKNLSGLTEMKLKDAENFYKDFLKDLKKLEKKYEGTWEGLEATFFIGNVYNMTRNFDEAVKCFDVVLNQEGVDKNFQARTLYFKIQALLGKGDVVNAKKTIEALKEIEPRAAASFKGDLSNTTQMGVEAPTFNVKDVNGKTVNLADYKGEVVLLFFWATWAEPCIQEFPKIMRMYTNLGSQGVKFIGISLDNDLENLISFMQHERFDWPQIFDGEQFKGELAQLYNVQNLPLIYVLDRKSKVRYIGNEIRGITMTVASILSETESEDIPSFR
ncbi:TlpA disulfide reductase family protein [Candidatus Kuenenia sp.]|uniref:TlpA disulfide reductase family protein n=1 Tax=Candidatus Kuenenia sp. TaxID=2499824 RepID=UPI00321F6FA4